MKEIHEKIYEILAHLALLHDDPKLDKKVGNLKDLIDKFSKNDFPALTESEKKFLRGDHELSPKD